MLWCAVLFLMHRRPPRSTRTATRCPYTTRFRSRLARTYGPTAGVVPPAIKWLLVANAGAFVLQVLFGSVITLVFGLLPAAVIEKGWVDRKSTRLNSSH